MHNDSDFFNIGNLKKEYEFGISPACEYIGTEAEKKKYEKIQSLEYQLHKLDMLNWYISTFKGLMFIPLAIENISSVYDEDIDIHICIDSEKASSISPSKELINPDMKGLEGIIFEEGIIQELLKMPETSEITYDEDITYSFADAQAEIEYKFSIAGINGTPMYNEDDYEREISKYIATPTENSKYEFVFSIKSLRANEKKWLGAALLIKPLSECFDITYSIKSKYSNGMISGKIKYKN